MQTEETSPAAAEPAQPHQVPAGAKPHVTPGHLIMLGAIGGFIAVTIMLIAKMPIFTPADPPRSSAQSAAVVAHPADAPASSVAPSWVGRRQATWARDGSRTIAFQLPATDDLSVWMTSVRPQLGVRCLYRATEVFVATGTAASVEGESDRHSVRVQLDNDPEELQQWYGSESEQELFAPDGLALTRRLARAHVLRFAFTPYNAKAVTATFLVEGFEPLAELVGRTCGWHLDQGRLAAQ